VRKYVRYYLGPTTGRDCRYWSDEKQEAKGCGTTCECPGMKDDLNRYHKYADLMHLYENDKRSLDNIWDEDWAVIQALIMERDTYKIEKAEEAERIKNLLGNNQGKLR